MIYRAAAAFIFAAAFFLNASPSFAVIADGLPEWLRAYALRGITAVWTEIPRGLPINEKISTLELVTSRLFTGYTVHASTSGGEPRVSFKAASSVSWKVILTMPELREAASEWFLRDTKGMSATVSEYLDGLPLEALSWADAALKEQIDLITRERLPGWEASLLVRMDGQDSVLQLSFRPQQPLLLAITPSVFSSTLPVMMQSDLAEKLVSGLSPAIGLPVAWVRRHKSDVEALAQGFLEERNTVTNSGSRVSVVFVPDQVAQLEANVNSDRLIFQLWLAAYAGIRGRYPEAGLMIGWNTSRLTGIEAELYNETILELSEFSATTRLGVRLPLWKDLRVGIEREWPDDETWYRVWWDSRRLRRPYAWWRYNVKHGHNAAIGYRLNEHISVEFHYDNRYDDKVGVRGILSL